MTETTPQPCKFSECRAGALARHSEPSVNSHNTTSRKADRCAESGEQVTALSGVEGDLVFPTPSDSPRQTIWGTGP